MRILFVGDVVGSMGREMITEYLPKLKKKHHPDFTIVNGENAASGRGITEKIYKKILQDGADMVTLGNHSWDNREIFDFIDSAKKMVRPANFPEGTPGTGLAFGEIHGKTVAVINVQGRTFMPPLDDPFQIVDMLVDEAKKKTSIIFVDFHAEATSEKQAMGWFLDGRVSAVVGTHTHVQTADNRLLPNGTAFMCDVGMTGPYDEVLGMSKASVLKRFQTSLPVRFEVPKDGRKILSACLIDIDHKTGKAKKIERILINDDHPFMAEY
jgi:2',3'-cyclic-nucleotide 2'-phosphodiesterase